MPDILANRGLLGRSRVNTSDFWEVNYWCKRLGCTEAKLREAVSTVGVTGERVRAYLFK